MRQREDKKTIERGIVLHTTKFGEGQVVAHLITRQGARRGYVARISSRSGIGRQMFSPLSILEFEAAYGSGDLGKMSSPMMVAPLFSIRENIVKCTLTLFISELLYRVAKGETSEDEGAFYDFLERSVIEFEHIVDPSEVANYHLRFMVRLASWLGYAPRMNWAEGMWFDIKTGEFAISAPAHSFSFDPQKAAILYQLALPDDVPSSQIALCGATRREFLASMIDYYAWHTDTIYSVRSVDILSEIF